MEHIVYTINQYIVTSSLIVAKVFGVKHKNILRKIDNLQKSMSFLNKTAGNRVARKNESMLNFVDLFAKSVYKDEHGRDQEMYIINHSGFCLLAMEFTGQKALRSALIFFKSFNIIKELKISIAQDHIKHLEGEIRSLNYISQKGGISLEKKINNCQYDVITTEEIARFIGIDVSIIYESLALLGVVFMIDDVWCINEQLGVGSMARETFTDEYGIKRSRKYILWNPIGGSELVLLSYRIYDIQKHIEDKGFKELESFVIKSEVGYNEVTKKIHVSLNQFITITNLLSQKHAINRISACQEQ